MCKFHRGLRGDIPPAAEARKLLDDGAPIQAIEDDSPPTPSYVAQIRRTLNIPGRRIEVIHKPKIHELHEGRTGEKKVASLPVEDKDIREPL